MEAVDRIDQFSFHHTTKANNPMRILCEDGEKRLDEFGSCILLIELQFDHNLWEGI
jgi:uncharacterized protein YlaI